MHSTLAGIEAALTELEKYPGIAIVRVENRLGPSLNQFIKSINGFIANRNKVALKGQPVLTPDSTMNKNESVPMPQEKAREFWYKW